MQLSEDQIRNLDIAYDAFEAVIERMKKGFKDGRKRLEALDKAGFHIERVMVNGQLVEHALKALLHACRFKRDIVLALGKPDPFESIYANKKNGDFKAKFLDFDDQPLGPLIGLVRKATGNDALADKLTRFNTSRKKFIHKTFDGINSFEEMNMEGKTLSESHDFSTMIMDISAAHRKVQEECAVMTGS